MFSYSTSVNLAWQIAAIETAQAGLQFIEAEQVLIGLLKAGDILSAEVRAGTELQFPQEDLELLKSELVPLEALFGKFRLDRIEVRRLIRGLVGKGDYVHGKNVVHRSEKCKRIFGKAEEIARGRHALTLKPLHFFDAIMEEPGDIIDKALSKYGVKTKALREAMALADEERQRVTVDGKDEKVKEAEMKKTGTPFLDRYGVDLTGLAREGKIDPLIGRREELLKMIRTLSRRTKNNPLLLGDAGVGKTAIVRGLALRIAQGNITPILQKRRIIELNMTNLVAGTKYRGEFEEKISRVLEETRKSDDVIIFIDEIHTIIGAGGSEGALDASNMLKPALSRGEVKCIGATTLSEYRKYFENDAALERRFQPIMVEEPTEEETLKIIQGLKERFEEHHQVNITRSALEASVKLAVKYIPDRRLPDKALDVIDEACSRVKIDSLSFYGKVEDLQTKIGNVTDENVACVVADWSGRPLETPGKDEKDRLSGMEGELKKHVVGQDEAIKKVSQIVKMARAGLKDSQRPIGVFLFLGPTGVGKTELAKALSKFLIGSEDQMIRLDMSEYMEKQNVARLIGAPPGYIGHDEEGQLTGKLRRHPYTVVLLDEIEKAHPEVLDIFLQLFDEGRLTDSKGRTVDAKNAMFVMTSNVGGEQYQRGPLGFAVTEQEEKNQEVMNQLKARLKPEFLGRIDEIIVFKSLDAKDMATITLLEIERLNNKLNSKAIGLEITDEAVGFLAREGYDQHYGARRLNRTIERLLSKPIADRIINGEVNAGDKLQVNLEEGILTIGRGRGGKA